MMDEAVAADWVLLKLICKAEFRRSAIEIGIQVKHSGRLASGFKKQSEMRSGTVGVFEIAAGCKIVVTA